MTNSNRSHTRHNVKLAARVYKLPYRFSLMLISNADTAGWKLIFQLGALTTASSNATLLHAALEVQRIDTKLFAITFMIAEQVQISKELKNCQKNFPQVILRN